MNILGIGKIGSAIAEKFEIYPQYSVFKIAPNLKNDKNNFCLNEIANPEKYEDLDINPNFDIASQLDVIMCGEDLMCAATLKILQNYKNCTIRIYYVKPSTKFLSEVQKLTDKVVYNVLQEYTRSKRFDSMYIFEQDMLSKTIGKAPLTQVKDKTYSYISYTIHMINFFDNAEPIMSNYQETPVTYCINTIGIMDFATGQENKLFSLDDIREKRYYYCINEEQLNSDNELFDLINGQIDSKIEENCSIMFGVYPSSHKVNYCYVIYKSPYIQK